MVNRSGVFGRFCSNYNTSNIVKGIIIIFLTVIEWIIRQFQLVTDEITAILSRAIWNKPNAFTANSITLWPSVNWQLQLKFLWLDINI